MGISLGKGLAIAGGLAAVGIGGYMLLKGDDKAKEAGEAGEKDPAAAGEAGAVDPVTGMPVAGAGDPTAGAADPMAAGTSGVPAPGAGFPTGGTGPGFQDPAGSGAGAATGAGGIQGEQVGPYTVVQDPSSGMELVFETATQQLQGVLDQQGNLIPATVDANGQVQLSQQQDTAGALGQGTTGPASHPGASMAGSSTSIPVSDTQRGAVYEQIAQELFANAADPTMGSATSDSMSGVANLAPAAGMQAGSVGASGPQTARMASAPMSTGAAAGGQVSERQVGEFTLLDDGSGTTVVLDTATRTPMGVMDAAGNVTPIKVDANGNVSVAGPSSNVGAGTSTGTAAPTTMAPTTTSSMPVGARY